MPRTIELRSSTVPGRTEHVDICELELSQCVISSANWRESECQPKRWEIVLQKGKTQHLDRRPGMRRRYCEKSRSIQVDSHGGLVEPAHCQ